MKALKIIVKILLCILVIAGCVAGGYALCLYTQPKPEPIKTDPTEVITKEYKADTKVLEATLKNASELTTINYLYTGNTVFTDKGVKFISRSDFSMKYNAIARIGINLEKVKIKADDENKLIIIEIPKAEVLNVDLQEDTISFYDEKFALFNMDEREDAAKAIDLAEKDVQEKIGKTPETFSVIESANNQAALLVQGILANAIPEGYQMKPILPEEKAQ